jgi:hypothetical protein
MARNGANSDAVVARNDVRLDALIARSGEWRGAKLARNGPWRGEKGARGGVWHGGQAPQGQAQRELAPAEQGPRAKGRHGSEMSWKHCGLIADRRLLHE